MKTVLEGQMAIAYEALSELFAASGRKVDNIYCIIFSWNNNHYLQVASIGISLYIDSSEVSYYVFITKSIGSYLCHVYV